MGALCGFGKVPDDFKDKLRLSPSKIKDFLESPKNYKYYNIDGNKKESKAIDRGNLIHMYLLEPEKFKQIYVDINRDEFLVTAEDIKKYCDTLGIKKTGKKEELILRVLEQDPSAKILDSYLFDLEMSGRKELKQADKLMLQEIQKEIDSQPVTSFILKYGEREKSMWFYEENLDIVFSMRVDFVGQIKNTHIVLDVKKVMSARPYKMQRWFDDTNTHVQLAMYWDCYRRITGVEPICEIMAVEDKAPYYVVNYTPDIAAMEIGGSKWRQAAMQIKKCYKENYFPGISPKGEPLSLSLPKYAIDREEFSEDEPIEG
jgi:hypothetical protein